jgi:hypothetical protein
MAADTSDDRIDLTDLDVIARYSLAVRAATAPRDEVIAALRADLEWLEGPRRTTSSRRAPAKTTRPRRRA